MKRNIHFLYKPSSFIFSRGKAFRSTVISKLTATMMYKKNRKKSFDCTALKHLLTSVPILLLTTPNIAFAQSTINVNFRVVVNSNQDGEIQADDALTLREAIAIVNGSLPLEQLSTVEKSLVSPGSSQSRITFQLPPGQTTIALQSVLPPLTTPGLTIDGTSQPGYDASKSATAEIEIPIPVVEITSASDKEVFRGLMVAADNITIQGLSIHGFSSQHRDTAGLPPGDIIVGDLEMLQIPPTPLKKGGYSVPTSSKKGGYGYSTPTASKKGGYGYSTPTSSKKGGYGYSTPTAFKKGGYGYSTPTASKKGGYGYSTPTSSKKGGYGYSTPTSLKKGGYSTPTSFKKGGYSTPTSSKKGGYGYSTPTSSKKGSNSNPNSLLKQLNSPPSQGGLGGSKPPQNTTIRNNWLGITPEEQFPQKTSAFGVSVFNATNTNITNNRIANHEGSAIITGKLAENTQIKSNIIVGNGIAGMPDAIRLEGKVNNSQVTSNLICANDGSGVYLFKPEGAVQIQSNNIKYNGRRLRRAGVYLMGQNHQVLNNLITNQPGSGVTVTSFPNSEKNLIRDNSFANIEGLSIDLNYRHNAGVKDYQRGDGPNPPRNSGNRRLDSANNAINAPEFLSSEFVLINGKVNIDGKADPGSEIDIYRITPNSKQQIDLYPAYSPLGQVIARAKADDKGRFQASFTNLEPGETISAIATLPNSGTSEPAANAIIKTINSQTIQNPKSKIQNFDNPICTTRPVIAQPIPEPEPIPEPPTPITLRVPRNIHFALDKDFISPKSGEILDRIAQVLQQYPNIVIELQGHTDSRASIAYNQDLAKRRATNARNYLIKKGIAPERMTIRSFGERKLRTQENNVIDYARNRRVEILFFDVRGIDIEFENQESDLQIEN